MQSPQQAHRSASAPRLAPLDVSASPGSPALDAEMPRLRPVRVSGGPSRRASLWHGRGPGAKAVAIALYSLCSCTMLVANKVAVSHLRVPTAVSGTQLLFTSSFVLLLHGCGVVTLAAPRRRTLQPFAVYTTVFAAGIYANIKALELTSVGAVIAARSCLPAAVAALEWAFMGRHLPSLRSAAALAGVLLAAAAYVRTDTSLAVGGAPGAAWLGTWWALLAFQMTYGKHLADEVELNESERVFYTNALSLPPTALLCLVMREHSALAALRPGPPALTWLFFSCCLGVGISYSGWHLKELVTATTFALVGVLNKMGTIAIAAVAFPGATSGAGVAALVLCILFGLAYQDAPLRGPELRGKARESVATPGGAAAPPGRGSLGDGSRLEGQRSRALVTEPRTPTHATHAEKVGLDLV